MAEGWVPPEPEGLPPRVEPVPVGDRRGMAPEVSQRRAVRRDLLVRHPPVLPPPKLHPLPLYRLWLPPLRCPARRWLALRGLWAEIVAWHSAGWAPPWCQERATDPSVSIGFARGFETGWWDPVIARRHPPRDSRRSRPPEPALTPRRPSDQGNLTIRWTAHFPSLMGQDRMSTGGGPPQGGSRRGARRPGQTGGLCGVAWIRSSPRPRRTRGGREPGTPSRPRTVRRGRCRAPP